MKLFWIFGLLASSIVLISFLIALSVFSSPSLSSTDMDKAVFEISKNHAKAGFIAGTAILFYYGALKKLFGKDYIYRKAFFISFAIALLSCFGYVVSFIHLRTIFLLSIIIIMFATLKLMESVKLLIETEKLPKIVLVIPLFESMLIFIVMTLSYIFSTFQLIKN
ncbi:MAG: hypothetical protein A2736_01040 [Candidatus Yanofskybacteria bacterium RIFCSPHIGHO2_01_FULL_41_27]|uniref:Uncharacterized protein n=3 Tax=Parcubacteria group TaxID=1794811 RepID=A0A1F8HUT5_9BACT|nr:MAG: hypothetical protein UU83_C0006G0019 [Candidatus Jorgensenbacteria bacterium GW2011_GWF2_41_8]OGM99598.1 MAG: hypothetical protein A2736_01040 [Candidatus Yanofskybacteria bacterium RIFCSPHIGHO2_01_FULL_41_27]OGN20076.1 MAG: hypothetical protein A3B00_00630 [Candidatus Yanofskybacteria bacterium RIFCSPLOWO2_01_FULL_41_33]OGN41262.1 MAG: hypothetical protein A2606_03025 [Candidatus Yanofskybacteria bacterium RIFOXYD1_FULL_42_10]